MQLYMSCHGIFLSRDNLYHPTIEYTDKRVTCVCVCVCVYIQKYKEKHYEKDFFSKKTKSKRTNKPKKTHKRVKQP